MKKRGFQVSNPEGMGLPVKAESRGKAKSKAHGHPPLDCEFTQLRVKRLPEIDDVDMDDVTAEFLMKECDWRFECAECYQFVYPDGSGAGGEADIENGPVFEGEAGHWTTFEDVYHYTCYQKKNDERPQEKSKA